jgi:hypothetical protein
MLSTLALLVMQPTDTPKNHCTSPETEREKAICAYLKKMEEIEIVTVDEVAFGTFEEMFSLRPAARECGLMNHVDPIDENRAYFQIVNASSKSKSCLIKWVRQYQPNLELTSERKKELEGVGE